MLLLSKWVLEHGPLIPFLPPAILLAYYAPMVSPVILPRFSQVLLSLAGFAIISAPVTFPVSCQAYMLGQQPRYIIKGVQLVGVNPFINAKILVVV
eukprot:14229278-Ditylum_brightwellii.AAC.1